MSRTYRRLKHRYEYRWVLHDWTRSAPFGATVQLDTRSPEGRRAITRFHSDAKRTMRGSASRWYRKVFDRSLRNRNDAQLRRWINDPGYDPIMQPTHLHRANWSWW
jgi:hypothetical protein